MKYTIFVTVEDFLNNGGQLEEGRLIYTAMNPGGICGYFNALIENLIEIREADRFICLDSSIVYVETEAEPVWK